MNKILKTAGFIYMCVVGAITAGYTYATLSTVSKMEVRYKNVGKFVSKDTVFTIVETMVKYDGEILGSKTDTIRRKELKSTDL